MTRTAGHTLRKEGKPYALDLCTECRHAATEAVIWRDEFGRRIRSSAGHGLCACGALSAHLPSDRQRKAWHDSHKTQMRNEGR